MIWMQALSRLLGGGGMSYGRWIMAGGRGSLGGGWGDRSLEAITLPWWLLAMVLLCFLAAMSWTVVLS